MPQIYKSKDSLFYSKRQEGWEVFYILKENEMSNGKSINCRAVRGEVLRQLITKMKALRDKDPNWDKFTVIGEGNPENV